MFFKTLKGKTIVAASSMVIASGISIALLISQRYGLSLRENMAAQAVNIAHSAALQAVDKILINDQVALQKMLDHIIESNPAISYIFVIKGHDVLAQTFEKGVPVGLLDINSPGKKEKAHMKRIASTDGQVYLDIAWPIFEGKAGILRMGLSEAPYRSKMRRLWIQIGILTAGILAIVVLMVFFLLKRIVKPVSELTIAIKRVERGEKGIRIDKAKTTELSALSDSFNHMMARVEEYTTRLEEKTAELARARDQARTFCTIVREIGSLQGLDEVGINLVNRIGTVLKCSKIGLLLNDTEEVRFYSCVEGKSKSLKGLPCQVCDEILTGKDGPERIKASSLPDNFLPQEFHEAAQLLVIPIRHGGRALGALISSCLRGCHCSEEDVNMTSMILRQAGAVLSRALMQNKEMRNFRRKLEEKREFLGIVGKDPKMQLIYKLIEDIAPTDASVLIQGESGTGKELVAQAIHERSPRKDKPFVVINCSAYPETLLESELFGHEKGAFTGAMRQKPGRFEQADGGTVFLDEVGEMSPSAQIKLLRVLQTHKFERIGGEHTLSVNVRVISATNKDLLREVKAGRFREDLYYRLNVIPISMPPLRERKNDIPLLARHFLRRISSEGGKEMDISVEALRLLMNYDWPGNVRELENTIEHAVVLAKDKVIHAEDLPSFVSEKSPSQTGSSPYHGTLEQHEKDLLEHVLEDCGWNKKQAAHRLGISRNTLYAKLKKYGISRPTTH